jgi:hypothetical protein
MNLITAIKAAAIVILFARRYQQRYANAKHNASVGSATRGPLIKSTKL